MGIFNKRKWDDVDFRISKYDIALDRILSVYGNGSLGWYECILHNLYAIELPENYHEEFMSYCFDNNKQFRSYAMMAAENKTYKTCKFCGEKIDVYEISAESIQGCPVGPGGLHIYS